MASLIIVFSSPGKKPLSVATVEDVELLQRAARLAIEQAEERAASAAGSDPVMALLQAAEVQRLRTALDLLVPGLAELPTVLDEVTPNLM
jgi:hypothetical protein